MNGRATLMEMRGAVEAAVAYAVATATPADVAASYASEQFHVVDDRDLRILRRAVRERLERERLERARGAAG